MAGDSLLASQVAGSTNQFGGVFTATAKGTDVTAPQISFPTDTTVDQDAAFDALADVSATDNADGDVSSSLQVVGSVDTS